MVAAPKSFDITIQLNNAPAQPYLYGAKGGLELGHGLLEPSAPSRVDTIPIQTLHHGYGRVIATDPNMARDSNGEVHFADMRQPGFIMPAGTLTLINQTPIYASGDVLAIDGYAATYTLDNGDVIFAAGKQLFLIDHDTEAVTVVNKTDLSGYFSGSAMVWNNDLWLGVQSTAAVTSGAYNYDTATENTTNTYMFSWAGSTRNSAFWVRNRSGAAPQLRWSDRTDQDFGAFNVNFIYPNATNAYVLEIPKGIVTGAGITGQYFLYASKGGNIWGLDRNEVFLPLTPDPVSFTDLQYGGQMNYVGSWLLVPNIDGLGRFDPRNVGLTDITPAVHQGATPEIGTRSDKSAQAVSTTPTGALIAANLIGEDINLLQLEMYEDGMFWHPVIQTLETALSGEIGHVWGIQVARYFENSQFTSKLKAYVLASAHNYNFWNLYKLDLATAAYAPGPDTLADVTGFRTGFYTGRPPDVNASVTQVRGYGQASHANYINLWLEVDDADEQYNLGIIDGTGPFVLPVPPEVLPGRKFAIAGKITVTSQSDTLPYLTLPLSIDYRYVIPKGDGPHPDFFTLKFLASSDQINRRTGHIFTHGRSETESLIELPGQIITVGFSDTDRKWSAIVEDAQGTMATMEDGRQSTDYLVTLVCRRVA